MRVATVLTVYGIETCNVVDLIVSNNRLLQQYLPFTVLKLNINMGRLFLVIGLQQYLPFTVLKPKYLMVLSI